MLIKTKNKRAQFLARHWIVAFVVFVSIVSLFYVSLTGIADEYDNTKIVQSNFNSTYNRFSDLSNTVSDMLNKTSRDEGLSFLGAFDVAFTATFTVIQLIYDTITLPGAMLKQFMSDLGVPSIVSNIAFALPLVILTVIIVLIVMSAVSRGKL